MQLNIKAILEARINIFLYDLRHSKFKTSDNDIIKVLNKIAVLENEIEASIKQNNFKQQYISLSKDLNNLMDEVGKNEIK